jgi:uncharacterized protein (TIGR00375 family)
MTNPVFQWKQGAFLADFHVHSHFSRATSPDMHPGIINRFAKQKGLSVVGTGDFTHPGYLEELREELEPEGTGLYVCKDDPEGTKFILTSEVSNIFTQGGKSRRIHTVFFAPDFQVVEEIQDRVGSIGNITSDGRPILGFPVKELVRIIMDVSPDCFVLPAHIWTPWFSLFGAKSGFDTLEECFEEQSEHIFALETGLSSDPQMNWRLSALDQYTLLSNSDAHSLPNLGREANIFDLEDFTYNEIYQAIKTNDSKKIKSTIEFYPEEGMYHYDGHRNCGVSFKPTETIKQKGICPVCKKPLVIGVMNRVYELADRKFGFKPKNARNFVKLVGLDKIIAEAIGIKSRFAKKVLVEYNNLINNLGTELDILMNIDIEKIKQVTLPNIAKGIKRMREGNLIIKPGFDGQYGVVKMFNDKDELSKQKKLF